MPFAVAAAASSDGPPALPAGVSIQSHTLTDCLEHDSHGFVYRATESAGGRVVLLREFFPIELVGRAAGRAVASAGTQAEFHRVLTDFIVQVSERSCIEHPALWPIEDYWLHGGTAWVKMPWVEDRTPQGGTHDPTGPIGDAWLDQWVLEGCEALEVACRGVEGEEEDEQVLATAPAPASPVGTPIAGEPPLTMGKRRAWWRIWAGAAMVASLAMSPAATPMSQAPTAATTPHAGPHSAQITGVRGSAASIAIRRGRSWVQLVLVGA